MLSKSQRLPIQYFFKRKGSIVRSASFLVKLFPPGTTRTRVGVIIGQTVSKKAVIRNRFRRWVISGFEEYRAAFPQADILFIAFPSLRVLDQAGVLSELEKISQLLAHSSAQTKNP